MICDPSVCQSVSQWAHRARAAAFRQAVCTEFANEQRASIRGPNQCSPSGYGEPSFFQYRVCIWENSAQVPVCIDGFLFAPYFQRKRRIRSMKLLILFLSAFSMQAFAGEYDDILAQQYRASQAAAGASDLNGFATYSARVGRHLTNYISARGGDPGQASCQTSTNYSCNPLPCTPYSSGSLNLLELGAPGHLFRSCDFSLPPNRACKAGRGECYRIPDMNERARCMKAQLVVSCVDRGTGQRSGDYMDSLEPRAQRRARP